MAWLPQLLKDFSFLARQKIKQGRGSLQIRALDFLLLAGCSDNVALILHNRKSNDYDSFFQVGIGGKHPFISLTLKKSLDANKFDETEAYPLAIIGISEEATARRFGTGNAFNRGFPYPNKQTIVGSIDENKEASEGTWGSQPWQFHHPLVPHKRIMRLTKRQSHERQNEF